MALKNIYIIYIKYLKKIRGKEERREGGKEIRPRGGRSLVDRRSPPVAGHRGKGKFFLTIYVYIKKEKAAQKKRKKDSKEEEKRKRCNLFIDVSFVFKI